MNLYKINYYAAYLHFLSAVVVAAVFYAKGQKANFDIDFYRLKITSISGDGRDITLEPEKALDLTTQNIEYIIIFIFLITGFFHMFYYTDGFDSGAYSSELDKGFNRIRWLEYGITATLMVFVLCILSGIKDYDTAILLSNTSIAIMSIGYFLEQSSTKGAKIMACVIGFYLLFVLFGTLMRNMFERFQEAKDAGKELPDCLYGVLTPMLFWFISFGVVAVLNVKNMGKKNYDFRKYEKYYIYLSYLSKAFMGYYIAFGLTRDKAEDKK